MLKCAFLLPLAFSLSSCIVNRAVDYSFNAPNHADFFIADHCFAIDDWPGERLLITDCGGYLNLLNTAVTFGLAQSEEAVAQSYRDAALDYLAQGQLSCSMRRTKVCRNLVFEIFYYCNTRNYRLCGMMLRCCLRLCAERYTRFVGRIS